MDTKKIVLDAISEAYAEAQTLRAQEAEKGQYDSAFGWKCRGVALLELRATINQRLAEAQAQEVTR